MYLKKLLELNTRKHLKTNNIRRSSSSFRKAKNIGIIFSIEDIEKHKAIKSFVKNLEDSGKKVDVLAFLGKGKQNHEFLFDFITGNDLNFWGNLTNQRAIEFSNLRFDFLFNMDQERNFIIENIIARSKASCRIGIHKEDNNDYYELLVHLNENCKQEKLIKELLFYAQKIT